MKVKFLILLFIFLTTQIVSALEYPINELGNCASENECEAYCNNLENIEVCIGFAEKNGLMLDKEIEKAKKILPYILNGTSPGGCSSKEECDNYCRQEENLEECIDFSLKIGDITEQEAEIARKTRGKGPGGCIGPTECSNYCSSDKNFEECIEFAYKYGILNKEEYEIAKKTRGKGPGGCRSKEECEAYCNEHKQECIEFAIENGLMDKKDIKRIKNMGEEERCIVKCLEEKDIDPRECGPGEEGERGGSACRECAEFCIKFYKGPCLTDEQWREKEKECMSRGEHMEAVPIEGEYPEQGGRKCVVDLNCIDRSDELGDMPGEGPGIGEEGWIPPEEWSEEQGGSGVKEENQESFDNQQQIQEEQETQEQKQIESDSNKEAITAEVILTENVFRNDQSNIKIIFR